jgi:hypothetical protein
VRANAPFIALALIALSARAARSADGTAYVERSEQTVEPAGITAVEIDNSRGPVRVAASADGRLRVVAMKYCRTRRLEDERRYARETTVETANRAGRYEVTVHYPRHLETNVCFWDLFSDDGRRRLRLPSVEVRLELQVPQALPVTVATTSGDMSLEGLAGEQSLHSTSGNIEAISSRGAIDAETTSGDIVLRAVSGARVRSTSGDLHADDVAALEAHSTSGDLHVGGARRMLALETVSGGIRVTGAPEGIHARTTSGRLEIEGACARVDVGTQSGDIRARLRAPLQAAEVSSGSGDVTLELAGGVPADLSAHSSSGSIDCSVPVTVLDHDRNSFQARIGRGGAPVRIQTTSGDVSITSGGK